ncbi:hypothetical protein [Herbaspirillum sp. VT-16-41]|uniref:hypothetical protein n=1 Tax=Herbaspirillum sp. VT-16-41 TaxID=1953765 RepID=UPI00098112C6|nr:hypothetical protein [Herbaspirillum sp. VT-16-41]ONN68145.1 hypothetical protein BTM36_01955 [Herbaspirillum sp. VT-16-41]
MSVLALLRIVPSWCYWILAVVALCLGCEIHGAGRVQAKWDLQEASRKAAEAQEVKSREAENQALKAQFAADRALMKKDYDAKLSDYADRLARSERLRLGAAWCDGATPGAGAISGAPGSNAADTDPGMVGADLQRAIDRFKERIAAGFETGRLAQQVIIKNGLAPAP